MRLHLKCLLLVYCDESAASPLIISTPRPLIAALHQAPDGSGCVREEGRCNSQVWRRVMRHTPEVNGASSPPLLYAGCASPLETGLFPRACMLVSSWVQEGSVEWEDRTRETADGPGCRAVHLGAPRVHRRAKLPRKPPPSRPRTQVGSACGHRTPPLTWTLPSRTLPLLHNPRSQRGHQIPCLFWTLYPLWTLLFYYFC